MSWIALSPITDVTVPALPVLEVPIANSDLRHRRARTFWLRARARSIHLRARVRVNAQIPVREMYTHSAIHLIRQAARARPLN